MVEGPRRTELFNERLETAKALQVAGGPDNWSQSVRTCGDLLDEFGLNPNILNVMGVPLRMLNRQSESITAFSLAAALSQSTGDWEQRLIAVSGLIDAWRTAGREITFPYPKYVKEGERVVYLHKMASFYIPVVESIIADVKKKTGVDSSLAHVEAYTQIGLLYNDMGKLPEALNAYSTAENNARKLVTIDPNNDTFQNRLARALHVKGVTQQKLGMIREARASQDEALPIFEKLDDTQNLCNVLASSGDLSEIEKQPDDARRHWERGLQVAQTRNASYVEAFEQRLARLQKSPE